MTTYELIFEPHDPISPITATVIAKSPEQAIELKDDIERDLNAGRATYRFSMMMVKGHRSYVHKSVVADESVRHGLDSPSEKP